MVELESERAQSVIPITMLPVVVRPRPEPSVKVPVIVLVKLMSM